MKKWILIGAGVLIVVIVGVVFVFVSNIDSIVKAAVEKYGSEATKAQVTLREVEISTTSGKGALRGLKVGNPSGFHTDSAIQLGEVSVTIDIGSLTSDTVIVKEVVIGGLQVTYEVGADGSNIDAIQKNVESYAGMSSGGSSSGGAKEGGGEGTKLIIENLYVRGGKVNVSATFLKGKKLGSPLPDIHLKDIGKDKGGASPAEVAKKIIDAISKGSGDAVSSLNLDELMDSATATAKGALDAVKGAAGGTGAGKAAGAAVDTATEAAGSAVDAAKEGAAKATGTLKKLLGN